MAEGFTRVYCGLGKGKTTVALGYGVTEAGRGKSVVIIQFLKNRNEEEIEFLRRLEPEVKLFRFEKSTEGFESLDEETKREEILNIKNGLNFARKVLSTEGADILILDEVLGLIDQKVIEASELQELLKVKSENTQLILTGIKMSPEIEGLVDDIISIDILKE